MLFHLRKPAVVLAALLQLLPLARTLVTHPATASTIAIILRWGLGATAVLGRYDACSGASAGLITTPTNVVGTAGTYLNTNVNFIIGNASNGHIVTPDDTITLYSSGGATSPALTNGMSTSDCLAPGLTFTCVAIQGATNIYGILSGTPTTVGVTNVLVDLYYAGGPQDYFTNFFITIQAPATVAPVITNQPAGVTNVAGGSATFTVLVGGSAPLTYQWYFNTNNALLNATNSQLSLTNLRASQAGTYSVTVTNAVGVTNSRPATLTVTNPLPPKLTAPIKTNGLLHFTFTPVVGLTNTVLTNRVMAGGTWAAFTNIPPPATTNPITITDPLGTSNRFYRVQILP